MTGLRCAEVLIKNGMKVTIIEGRDRIGGRVEFSQSLGTKEAGSPDVSLYIDTSDQTSRPSYRSRT